MREMQFQHDNQYAADNKEPLLYHREGDHPNESGDMIMDSRKAPFIALPVT